MSVDPLCRLFKSQMMLLLSLPQQLRPGTYVKKLGKQRVATGYTCKKKFTSQRGFEKHVDAEVHFPVPQEYAATASTADEVVVAATASTADEVVVGSKGTTKFLLF